MKRDHHQVHDADSNASVLLCTFLGHLPWCEVTVVPKKKTKKKPSLLVKGREKQRKKKKLYSGVTRTSYHLIMGIHMFQCQNTLPCKCHHCANNGPTNQTCTYSRPDPVMKDGLRSGMVNLIKLNWCLIKNRSTDCCHHASTVYKIKDVSVYRSPTSHIKGELVIYKLPLFLN